MINRLPVILILIIFCSALIAEDRVPQSIAVLEFEAKGVSKVEASTLTDRLRSELVRSKAFTHIERSKIDQVLEEQAFQVSGPMSDETLVEIGELLGAELVVVGSIGKLGSTYTIDLRVVEVASAEIIGSYFKDHRGEIDGLLTKFTFLAAEIAEGGAETVSLENLDEPEPTNKPELPDREELSAEAIRLTARQHAQIDFDQRKWMGFSGATGCVTGAINPALGLLGIFGSNSIAKIARASVPAERLAEIVSYDLMLQALYEDTYTQELKRIRKQTSTQASFGGCCVGMMVAGSIVTAINAASGG